VKTPPLRGLTGTTGIKACAACILISQVFCSVLCTAAERDTVPSSRPEWLTAVKGKLFFTADDGVHGRELWVWRPSGENPGGECGIVHDLLPGREGSSPVGLSSHADWLYFKARDAKGQELLYQCNADTYAVEPLQDMHGVPLLSRGAQTPYLFAEDGETFYVHTFLFENGEPPEGNPPANTAQLWRGQFGVPQMTHMFDFPGFFRQRMRDCCMFDGEKILLSCWGRAQVVDGATGTVRQITLEENAADGWNIRNPVPFGDGALFVGNTRDSGAELWFTEGTQEGTRRIKDIAPGPDTSSITGLYVVGKLAFFAANDGIHGLELWRTDGTPEGTLLLKDIYRGADLGDPYNLRRFGDQAWFVANDGIHGKEPWVTDGTPEGTRLLMDIFQGPKGSEPWDGVGSGEKVYFCATSSTYGDEIFVSDGTPEGTRLLADISRGSTGSGPDNLVLLKDKLFFTCDEPLYGEELWVSDGTGEGTRLVRDIYPALPNPSSSPRELTAIVDKVCFVVSTTSQGDELWISDGTEAGTGILRDIVPGAAGAHPGQLTALGDKLYFTADDALYGEELWVTDGTTEGTTVVADLRPGQEASRPADLYATAAGLFFTADDGRTGREPWFVDGNGTAPVLLGDLAAGTAASETSGFFEIEGRVYAYFRDTGGAMILWRFMPRAAVPAVPVKCVPCPAPPWEPGTLPGGEIVPEGAGIFSERDALLIGLIHPCAEETPGPRAVWVDGTAYFCLYTGEYGAEPWRSDGTLEGTRLLRDCNPGTQSSSPSQLAVSNRKVYFLAEDVTAARVVWQSDGTTAGTTVIHPRNDSETFGALAARELLVGKDALWVIARSLKSGENFPCVIRVKTSSTFEFEDFNPQPSVCVPRQVTCAGEHLFFVADDGVHGEELWVAGTASMAHATMVKDILPPVKMAPPEGEE